MKSKKIIAIVGPTASGKTGIGVGLAKKFGGEIVSADSRQVFCGLDIGTGKEGVSRSTYHVARIKRTGDQSNDKQLAISDLRTNLRCIEGTPQWMIDVVEPGEKFTLFDYLPLAREVIEDIFNRGKVPIVVGGTGLYVQGLIEGFALESISNPPAGRAGSKFLISNKFPNQIDKNSSRPLASNNNIVRASLSDGQAKRELLNNLTIEQLNHHLKRLDSIAYEKVDKNNPHRLIRAIERTQEGLKPTKKKPDFKVLQIGLNPKREELFKKIDDRVEERFENGMLEEIINLLAAGVRIDWMIKIGLEYKIIGQFIWEHSPVSPTARSQKSKVESQKQLSNQTIEQFENGPSPSSSQIDQIANHLRSLPGYEVMKQELKWKIHAFARRQLTWFRRFPEIRWLCDYKDIESQAKIFLEK